MGLIDIGLLRVKNKVNINSKARIEGKNTIKGGVQAQTLPKHEWE